MALPSERTMTRHILRAFDSVSAEDVTRYSGWYGDARRVCESLALMANLPLENVVGALAWTSPQQSFASNVAMTVALVEAFAKGDDLWSVPLSQYPDMVSNAIGALEGDLSTMLFHDANGKRRDARKVRSFFRNLMGDEYGFVTIDRHAVAIAIGNYDRARNGRYVTINQPKGRAYLSVERAYAKAARARGLSPAALQAVVWCARRGTAE